jgi:hypothetical protein
VSFLADLESFFTEPNDTYQLGTCARGRTHDQYSNWECCPEHSEIVVRAYDFANHCAKSWVGCRQISPRRLPVLHIHHNHDSTTTTTTEKQKSDLMHRPGTEL